MSEATSREFVIDKYHFHFDTNSFFDTGEMCLQAFRLEFEEPIVGDGKAGRKMERRIKRGEMDEKDFVDLKVGGGRKVFEVDKPWNFGI